MLKTCSVRPSDEKIKISNTYTLKKKIESLTQTLTLTFCPGSTAKALRIRKK